MRGQQVYKSRSGMSVLEGAFHALMIMCTMGLWYPVYRARKHAVDRTTTTYAVPGAPAAPYVPQQLRRDERGRFIRG